MAHRSWSSTGVHDLATPAAPRAFFFCDFFFGHQEEKQSCPDSQKQNHHDSNDDDQFAFAFHECLELAIFVSIPVHLDDDNFHASIEPVRFSDRSCSSRKEEINTISPVRSPCNFLLPV